MNREIYFLNVKQKFSLGPYLVSSVLAPTLIKSSLDMGHKYKVSATKREVFPNGSTSNVSNNATYDVGPSEKSEVVERGEWANKWEFVLSCIGMSVGLGNVWRFPYLAYENEGATFLIAYIILQFLIGKPMYLMELVLAQYSGKGPTTIWAMNPSGKGIGIAQGLISLVAAVYYNVIMAYTLYYMFATMQATLPWTVCKEEWKQYGCVEQTTKRLKYCDNPVVIAKNATDCRCTLNATFDNNLPFNCTDTSYTGEPTTVADLYFNQEVIHKAINMYPENVGPPLWKLALCLLLSWIIVVIGLIKGIMSSGKFLFIYRMVQYNPPEINDNLPYPEFAQIIGWILTTFVMCPVPLMFLYKLYQAKGSLWKNGNGVPNGNSVTKDSIHDVISSDKANVVDRGEWGNKWEFILSCVGLSVGLGNVWRFPYLAYENGGAAFLIAYLILQILIGKPMYLMELVIGQYSGKGPTSVWAMNPSAKGIGISMALISLVVTIYYNVIMSYTLFYFFSSMQATLPWTVCKPEWMQYGCVEQTTKPLKYCNNPDVIFQNLTDCRCTLNATFDSSLLFNCTNTSYTGEPTPVAEIYFYKEVIEKSSNMYPKDVGAPLWKLTLCLLLSWIIVVVCLIKGIKTSGKVVYFTATFPYVILLILLVRGATLDGAIDGVIFFVVPKWEKLLDLKVWVAAAGQMFFSLSVSFGGIIMFGSYNKFKNNVYGDAMLISIMDVFTSVLAGFVIFTTFGGMAKAIGVSVEDVAKGGYGLAFVAYPEALSSMPPPQLWSILFFFMLFNLGLSSEFGLLETVLTCIQDEFPHLRKYKGYMCAGFGVVFFLLGLPCVTPAGDYIVTLMDHYGADFSVLFVACCECVAVIWVYGIRRFIQDMTYMLGRAPRPVYFWGFCWAFCAPVIIALLFIYRMVEYDPLKISSDLAYPEFAQTIGWVITVVVICPIPITFIYMMYRAKGSLWERLKIITTPTLEWGPNDASITTSTSELGLTNASEKIHCMDDMMSDGEKGTDNPIFFTKL